MVSSHGRFVWYELVTTDVAAATAFYTRVMGWGAWDASAPGRPYILFGDGKSAISALTPLPDDARQMGVEPVWVGYVGVDDVDATTERIARLGGAVQVPPTDVVGYQPLFGLHRPAERTARAVQVAQSRPATARRAGRSRACRLARTPCRRLGAGMDFLRLSFSAGRKRTPTSARRARISPSPPEGR